MISLANRHGVIGSATFAALTTVGRFVGKGGPALSDQERDGVDVSLEPCHLAPRANCVERVVSDTDYLFATTSLEIEGDRSLVNSYPRTRAQVLAKPSGGRQATNA